MKKFLLLPFIFVCLSVQWSMAQAPKWVEKAKRAVFSVVIYVTSLEDNPENPQPGSLRCTMSSSSG